MKRYIFNTRSGDYTVTLRNTGKRDRYNHILVRYALVNPQGVAIFSGDDLGASPMHGAESMEIAIALLGFLTLKPGDTDDEYFTRYTPAQLTWCEGNDCENLLNHVAE